jgi:hypothetical protein
MRKLSEYELKALYLNFTTWRDVKCYGMASMSVQDFYLKFGLENPCA